MLGGRLSFRAANSSPKPSQEGTINSSDYARKCKEFMKLHRDIGRLACPMECTMSTTEKKWSCSISLKISYAADGTPVPQVIRDFGHTTDKKDVEVWIRRAQAALLNPLVPNGDFLNKSHSDLKTFKHAFRFSKNVVCVHVSDPDLTDLSFIDLPGLIQNSENDDDILLVKDLVVKSISDPNTLILVTIPTSDDMQNQAAARLAREADPSGERTIGVLTKPDTVSDGATGQLQNWKDVLEGKAHFLKHGYYCVRLPNDAERSRTKSRSDLQKFEARFFENISPWNTIADRERFGVPNFVANISELLVQLIEKKYVLVKVFEQSTHSTPSLPALRAQVAQLLLECESELQNLPILNIGDPATEVHLRITHFCEDFRASVFGEREKTLVQCNRARYDVFVQEIYSTRPNFAPYPYDDRESQMVPPSGPPIDLPEVKKAIALSIGWELPGFLPFDSTRDYIVEFTASWKQHTLSCFRDIYKNSHKFAKELMTRHFGQFKNLESHVESVLSAELEAWEAETMETLMNLVKLEGIPTLTQNKEFFLSERTYWFQRYRLARFTHYRQSPDAEIYKNDADYDALFVMASVRAYFQVAHKARISTTSLQYGLMMRIIDYVPLTIEHKLNQSIANHLQRSLFESLQQGEGTDRDKMVKLLTEDPSLATKRQFLEDRQRRLKIMKAKLNAFGHDRDQDIN
ncbi:hypothetical protein H0H92_015004 [Tricholoma furcatifolium]|nr:hypothetical protein H0H92_015004 [Tricholoma furcatifolium]